MQLISDIEKINAPPVCYEVNIFYKKLLNLINLRRASNKLERDNTAPPDVLLSLILLYFYS